MMFCLRLLPRWRNNKTESMDKIAEASDNGLFLSSHEYGHTVQPLLQLGYQFSSVTQSCLTLCYPMNCSMAGLPVHHQLPEFTQTHVHWVHWVIPPNHLILCRPLFLLPPIPPSIRVLSNESTLRIRWPKYWSCNLSLSPSNEHPGLISFRMDCYSQWQIPTKELNMSYRWLQIRQ